MGVYETTLREIISTPKDRVRRSFFIKRIERVIRDRVEIPGEVFALFDTPFEEFTPECEELFERELVEKSIFWMFSDVLAKICRDMNADRHGWEAAAEFLEDTPIKYCALHAMEKVEKQRESSTGEDFLGVGVEDIDLRLSPEDQKFGVRPYIERSRNRRRGRGELKPCFA